jgi:excisionase family DNA binding protein
MMTLPPSPSLLTREGLALALGVHKTTVYRLTALGRIPYVSVGRRGKRYELQAVVRALASKPSVVVTEAVSL